MVFLKCVNVKYNFDVFMVNTTLHAHLKQQIMVDICCIPGWKKTIGRQVYLQSMSTVHHLFINMCVMYLLGNTIYTLYWHGNSVYNKVIDDDDDDDDE